MTANHKIELSKKESLQGVFCALGAFSIWGLSPIYFKAVRHVPAFEILMHRMVWSFLFLLPLVIFLGRWREFKTVITTRRTLLILLGTTVLVSSNWFIYIWAINADKILQTSLGYYITPLVNILLGMIFLKERLRPAQILAVILAAIGVLYMTVEIGTLPWIALSLALTFGFYALIRKVAPVNPLVGLTIETLLLCLPAVGYLIYLDTDGAGAYLRISLKTDVLLMCAALMTALPLLLFTTGSRRIHLSTAGILSLIWTAVIIYSIDSVFYHRRQVKT
jgi:chloramphenicol-sensitive protein RarD